MAHQHDHKPVYIKVWLSLYVLTVITVGAAYVNFGQFNSLIAMAIATLKAWLVCWFFMHLKEDSWLNRIVFFSSLVFLIIFIVLTLADTDYRQDPVRAQVLAVEEPAGNEAKQHEQFKTLNPELLAHGQTVFTAQCATCHGAAGKGDGPAAAALNPAPRDFSSGTWTQGSAPSQIFLAITNGVPGTGMPPFAALSVRDRWALTHYIRSLSPKVAEETPATWTQSKLTGDGAAQTDTAKAKLPTQMAVDLLIEEAGNKE